MARKIRLLFSSYHSLFDPASGAARSVRDLFKLLGTRNYDCHAFCGPQLDFRYAATLGEFLHSAGGPVQVRSGTAFGLDINVYNFNLDGAPVTQYETPGHPAQSELSQVQSRTHTGLFQKILQETAPDILLTYGGQPMAHDCMALARKQGVKVVFWLRNTLYRHLEFFEHTSGVLVPSEFTRDFYARSLGLESTVIPSALNWDRVRCGRGDRQYLTFVNPQPYKGVYVVAGILRNLASRRPEIPLLLVENNANRHWLSDTGIDLSGANIHRMSWTHDPRQFYAVTRVLLAPSLWRETFGRVTAEAMVNGIPVVASRRGGLPETLGASGFALPLPDALTADSRTVPSTDEIAEFVDAIVRLWDDQDFYDQACARALAEADKWRPEVLAERYNRYFRKIACSGEPM